MTLSVARYVSDKYVRRATSILGALITKTGVFIQSFSNCYTASLISRMILYWGLSFYFIAVRAWISGSALSQQISLLVPIFNGSAYLGGCLPLGQHMGLMKASLTTSGEFQVCGKLQ